MRNKNWCKCWICGKDFVSNSWSNDCGSNDAQHVKARSGL